MDYTVYLMELIKKRNQKELIFQNIITHYQEMILDNRELNNKITILENKIKKSYECTGYQAPDNLEFKTDYFI